MVGFLLETNKKMERVSEAMGKLLPANRFKLTVPSRRRVKKTGGGILSLFGKKKVKITRTKNFITPKERRALKKIPGVKKIIPIQAIDFPMGVEFAVPGTGNRFRAEVIGIGLPSKYARRFINRRYSKRFRKRRGEVPVLLASYILDIFNAIIQNNDIPFKLNKKTVLGLRFQVAVGASSFGFGANNGTQQKVELYSCKVVGFIDMDYTFGIAFPSSFISKYKRRYWKNYRPGYYDSLMVELALENFGKIKKAVKKKGFLLRQNTGVFQKVSRFVKENQKGLGLFLKLISLTILVLGLFIAFYTVLSMLRGKSLEFSLYRFFGTGNLRIALLFGSYLTVLNLLVHFLAHFVLKSVFLKVGEALLKMKNVIPAGFESILEKNNLMKPQVLGQFLPYSFVFLEAALFAFIGIYLLGLNRRL